ncbi:hypothetical protein GW17_00019948 [Ensete ventricosum]|nr:hypothetical protein GW17_00019948 [Ensete ventricosum]
MRLPRGPYSRRILLLRSSVNSSDWMVMYRDPAIPCNHQLNLGLLINLGVGKRLEKVCVFNFCWLPHRMLLSCSLFSKLSLFAACKSPLRPPTFLA